MRGDHPLDRPVWSALALRQRPLSEGGPAARRFVPDIGPLAAPRDDGEEAMAALAALLPEGDSLSLVENPAFREPPGFVVERRLVTQMTATRPIEADPAAAFVQLGPADAAEMLALATLTRPGPFAIGTWRLGGFIGVRESGRLVAMAGERLKPDGHAEVSGVCTHPDARGRGHAKRLMRAVAAAIQARGEVPFLHSYSANSGAIALYERLGFVRSRELVQVILARR